MPIYERFCKGTQWTISNKCKQNHPSGYPFAGRKVLIAQEPEQYAGEDELVTRVKDVVSGEEYYVLLDWLT